MNNIPVAPLRLAPDMASRRLQVLAFVRVYITRWGEGPSYGEIAQAVGTNRERVKDVVRQLIAQGLLLRAPGMRGLVLPDRRDDALRLLRELGWTVEPSESRVIPPTGQAVTNPALQALDVLDYDGGAYGVATGGNDGTKKGAQSRKGRRRRPDHSCA